MPIVEGMRLRRANGTDHEYRCIHERIVPHIVGLLVPLAIVWMNLPYVAQFDHEYICIHAVSSILTRIKE